MVTSVPTQQDGNNLHIDSADTRLARFSFRGNRYVGRKSTTTPLTSSPAKARCYNLRSSHMQPSSVFEPILVSQRTLNVAFLRFFFASLSHTLTPHLSETRTGRLVRQGELEDHARFFLQAGSGRRTHVEAAVFTGKEGQSLGGMCFGALPALSDCLVVYPQMFLVPSRTDCANNTTFDFVTQSNWRPQDPRNWSDTYVHGCAQCLITTFMLLCESHALNKARNNLKFRALLFVATVHFDSQLRTKCGQDVCTCPPMALDLAGAMPLSLLNHFCSARCGFVAPPQNAAVGHTQISPTAHTIRAPVPVTQTKNGDDFLTARENKLAKFNNSGEVGYWKLVRRPIPGAPKRQTPLSNEGIDYLVLDIPEQGPRRNLIVSYEVCATIFFFALVAAAVCFVASGVASTDRLVVYCVFGVRDGRNGRGRHVTRVPCSASRFFPCSVSMTGRCVVSRAHRTCFPIRGPWALGPFFVEGGCDGGGVGEMAGGGGRLPRDQYLWLPNVVASHRPVAGRRGVCLRHNHRSAPPSRSSRKRLTTPTAHTIKH